MARELPPAPVGVFFPVDDGDGRGITSQYDIHITLGLAVGFSGIHQINVVCMLSKHLSNRRKAVATKPCWS